MPLSFGQYQGLFWTAIVASLASLLGSGIVVRESSRRRKGSLQQRLLLSLSVNDAMASINSMTLALMVPKGTPQHYWAIGNSTTCTISGFLTILLFLTTTCYNCSLSVYYALVVRYGYREEDILRKIEIAVHVFTWCLALSFAILGVVFKGYNPKIIVNICFLDSCSIQDMVDSGGCPDSAADLLAGGYIIAVAVFAALALIATAVVYRHVRRKITGSDGTISFQNVSEDMAKERLRLVSSQAVAYTCIYLNLLLWQSVLVILSFGEEWAYFEGEGQWWFYLLQLLSWAFIPGQGFLNCLVYTRPKYLKWKQIYPEAGIVWLYWQAFQMNDPPNRAARGDKALSWRASTNPAPPGMVATGDPELVGVSSFSEQMSPRLDRSKKIVGTMGRNINNGTTKTLSLSATEKRKFGVGSSKTLRASMDPLDAKWRSDHSLKVYGESEEGASSQDFARSSGGHPRRSMQIAMDGSIRDIQSQVEDNL